MDLPLHPLALNCCVSGRAFAEGDRVVSYLVRPSTGSGPVGEAKPAVARFDLLESEDPPPQLPSVNASPLTLRPEGPELAEWAFVFCRWVTVFKPRAAEENPDRMLKLTAENLFLTLADPAAERSEANPPSPGFGEVNTPLLQFLALMLERKRLIKPRGRTEDGARVVYEHMASHQLYEVPAGTLDDAFFVRIQEHLGVLVGEPKKREVPAPAVAVTQQ